MPGRPVIIQTWTPLSVSYKAVLVHEFARPPKFALRSSEKDWFLPLPYENLLAIGLISFLASFFLFDHVTVVYLYWPIFFGYITFVYLTRPKYYSFWLMRRSLISFRRPISYFLLLMRRPLISSRRPISYFLLRRPLISSRRPISYFLLLMRRVSISFKRPIFTLVNDIILYLYLMHCRCYWWKPSHCMHTTLGRISPIHFIW